MKFFCRALCVLLISAAVVRAQDEDEADYGDYKPTLDDELIEYVPKYTVRLGFRGLTGVQSEFGGQGTLVPRNIPYDSTTSLLIDPGENREGEIARVYNDGYVLFDQRTTVDPAGNAHPVSDGRTNLWTFTNAEQVRDDGLIAMHVYRATLSNTGMEKEETSLGTGVELTVERDFGSLFGTRIQWGFVGGMSVNQFNAIKRKEVSTLLEITEDIFSTGGQNAPEPGATSHNVLLDLQPVFRGVTYENTGNALTTRWQSRGAYMTFRAGPTLFVPLRWGLSASVSAGAVLVYAGSSYSVEQSFKPETGYETAQYVSDDKSAILPGFYVDASLQWAMTDTAGLYVGAVYQSSGDYTQTLTSEQRPGDDPITYSNRVDLSSLQGLRAGMSFRF